MALQKTFIALFLLGMIMVPIFVHSIEPDIIAIAGTETGILLWSPQQPNKDANIHLSAQGEKGLIFNLRTSTQLQERMIYLAIYDSDTISETTQFAAKKAVINMLNPYDTSTSDKASEAVRAVKGVVIGTVPVVLGNDGMMDLVLKNGWETAGVGILLDKKENNFIRFLPRYKPTAPVILLNPEQLPNKNVNVHLEVQQGLHVLDQAPKASKQSQKQQFVLGSIVLENDGTLSLLTLDKRVVIKPSVHEGIQDILMNLAIIHVDPSKVVQARAKEILEKVNTPYIQKTLAQLATAESVPEIARTRAKEALLTLPPNIEGQLELLKIALNEIHSLTRDSFHIIKEVENIQARAKEILLEMTRPLRLQVQEQLVIKALSDPVPRTLHLTLTVRDRARNILTNVKLNYNIQAELVSIATGFIRPHQKRNLFDRLYSSFFNNYEPLQTRAKEILIGMKNIDLEVQKELVRIATSDVAFAAARTRAKEILIEMKALNLEAQQELVRVADSDTLLPKMRARKILTQIKSIHPTIARNMSISSKCQRIFRRWMPAFAVAQ